MSSRPNSRSCKIIDPDLQFGLMLYALLAGGVAVLVHGVLVTRAISKLALDGLKGEELLQAVPGIVVADSLLTLALLVPVVLLFGRSMTHRLAGPLYRFRVFLGTVADGSETEPCRIRKGDMFVDICDLINETTAPARARNATSSALAGQEKELEKKQVEMSDAA